MRETTLPVVLPLDLTAQQCNEYEEIAETLLSHTIAQCVHYAEQPRTERSVDARRWKLQKQRDKMSVYRSRDKHHSSPFHEPDPRRHSSAIHASAEWIPQAKLCSVGEIDGSLDDVMYGGATPTETASLIRSMLIQDSFNEHRSIFDIRIPTENEPFRYVGLTWSGRTPHVLGLVKPRDMVYVKSTGIREVTIGGQRQRLGYATYHSVDMPELPPLTSQGFLRSRFSLCTLFREPKPGVVSVYSTSAIATDGELPPKIAAAFSAGTLVTIHKVIEAATTKKLVWMQAARTNARGIASGYLPAWSTRRHSFLGTILTTCPQCTRDLTGLRSPTICVVCDTEVCPRCITSRKLPLGNSKHTLRYKSVAVCKGCISTACRLDIAPQLAVHEFVRPFELARDSQHFPSLASSIGSYDSIAWSFCSFDLSRPSGTQSTSSFATDDLETFRIADSDARFSNATTVASGLSAEKVDTWTMINELRVRCEETYRMTKQLSLDVERFRTAPGNSQGRAL